MDTARMRIAALTSSRTGSLVGRVVVPANGSVGRTRIRIAGTGIATEFDCTGGAWERFGLPPGIYRVELVADRIVLAKRVVLAAGDETIVDFEVR
jgi:hypothetical protein